MLTKKRFMKLLILFTIVSMVIVACDRPLPNNNNATPQTNDNSYPGPTESVAVGGNTATDPNEPSAAEVPAEASEVEVPAEATSAAPSEASEGEVPAEASEVEVPAEADGEPTSGETEVPAEGVEGSAPEVEGTSAESIPATHTVAAGENLYRIGLQYGISWVAIAQANGITNPDRIYAGQVLDLPGSGEQGSGGQPEPMPTPEGINYVVKPGDTLFKIAQQFKTSWVEIAEANGLVNPNEIYAGQLIKIPVDAPMPAPVVHHVVQPGETLFRISLQYGLSWLAIANANQIGPPYIIYAGQTLIIPGGN